MSARRTKASRRKAFRAWVAQFAPPLETRPVWVVKIDLATLRELARRVARALRELARTMRAFLPAFVQACEQVARVGMAVPPPTTPP